MKKYSFLELVNKFVENYESLTEEEKKYVKNSFDFYLSPVPTDANTNASVVTK